jgi:hypothetical protein
MGVYASDRAPGDGVVADWGDHVIGLGVAVEVTLELVVTTGDAADRVELGVQTREVTGGCRVVGTVPSI